MVTNGLTIAVDSGAYKVILTSTEEQVNICAYAYRTDGTEQSLMNQTVPRETMPRANLLVAGIDAWARELFSKALESRGEQQRQAGTGTTT